MKCDYCDRLATVEWATKDGHHKGYTCSRDCMLKKREQLFDETDDDYILFRGLKNGQSAD